MNSNSMLKHQGQNRKLPDGKYGQFGQNNQLNCLDSD